AWRFSSTGTAAAPAPSASASNVAVALAPASVPSASVDEARTTPALPAARPPRSSRTPSQPTPKPVATAAEGTGFVAFRALDGATRTAIVVDGVPHGFAPRMLELSAGTHTVSFVAPSGATFGTRQIVVRQEHSRSSPK